jgi:serine-threonine kinase receptor-associated protein
MSRQIPIVCPGHTRPLASLQYLPTPDGPFLTSACHDKCPMLRRGTTGDWVGTWLGHKGAVWEAELDGRANLCATASGDFSASLWDAITGEQLAGYPHKHIVKTVAFSPDSGRLATGGHEGVLRVFDLSR